MNADTDVSADADADADGVEDVTAASDAQAHADAAVNADTGAGAAATGAAATGSSTKRGGNRVFTRQGRRPHLSVTIGLSTLAGLDNLPGTLAGFGAIPAGLARSIAASAATINALITDPDTGTSPPPAPSPTDPPRNSATRSPPSSTCASSRPAGNPSGAATWTTGNRSTTSIPNRAAKPTTNNIGPFCRRHHLIKHHSDWRIRIDPNRHVLEFTSPTGHTLPETRQAGRRTRTVGQHRRHRHRRTPRHTSPPHPAPSSATPTTNPPRPATSKTYSPPS